MLEASLPPQQCFHMRRQEVLSCLGKGKRSPCSRNVDADSLLDYSHQLVTGHMVSCWARAEPCLHCDQMLAKLRCYRCTVTTQVPYAGAC